MALGDIIEYGLEVDLRGPNPDHDNLNNLTFGIVNGVMRLVTGKGSLVNGADTFYDTMLTSKGLSKVFSRVDITETGNYATFARLVTKLDNTSGISSYLRDNGVYMKGAKVNFFIIINGTFYQRWSGEVDDDPWDRTIYQLKCVDNFRSLHKEVPGKFINQAELGVDVPDSTSGQAIPVIFGNYLNAKLLPITSETSASGFVYDNGFLLSSRRRSVNFGIIGIPADPVYTQVPRGGGRFITIYRGGSNQNFDWTDSVIEVVQGNGQGEQYKVVSSEIPYNLADGAISGGYYIVQVLELDRPWDNEKTDPENPTIPPTRDTGSEWSVELNDLTEFVYGDVVSFWGCKWQYVSTTPSLGDRQPGLPYGTGVGEAPWKMYSDWNFTFVPLLSSVPKLNGFHLVKDGLAYSVDDGVRQGDDRGTESYVKPLSFKSRYIACDGQAINIIDELGFMLNPLRVVKDNIPSYIHTLNHKYYLGDLIANDYSGVELGDVTVLPENKFKITGKLWSARSDDVFLGYRLKALDTTTQHYNVLYSSTNYNSWERGYYLDARFNQLPPSIRDHINDDDFTTGAGDQIVYSVSGTNDVGTIFTETGSGVLPLMADGQAPTTISGNQEFFIDIIYKISDFEFDFEDINTFYPCLEFDLVLDMYKTGVIPMTMSMTTRMNYTTVAGQKGYIKSAWDYIPFSVSANSDGVTPDRITQRFTSFPESARQSDINAIILSGLRDAGVILSKEVDGKNPRDWIDEINFSVAIRLPFDFSNTNRAGVNIIETSMLSDRNIEGDAVGCQVFGPAMVGDTKSPQNFQDSILEVMQRYDGLDASSIDLTSFSDALQTRAEAGLQYTTSRQLLENENSVDIIIEMLRQGLFLMAPDEAGLRRLVDWTNTRTPVARHSTLGDVVIANAQSILNETVGAVKRVATTKVYTSAELKFDWSNISEEYQSVINVTKTDEASFPAPDTYVTQTTFGVIDFTITDNTESWKTLGFKGRYNVSCRTDPSFPGQPRFTTGDRVRLPLPDGNDVEFFIQSYSGSQFGSGFNGYSVNPYDMNDDYLDQVLTGNGEHLSGGRLWQTFVTGVDESSYSVAKEVWTNFHYGYLRMRVQNPLPSSLAETKWINHGTVDKTDFHNPLNYLLTLSRWVTFPKEEVKYSVNITDNVSLKLGDAVEFVDPQYTQGIARLGWIVDLGLDASKNRFDLAVILDKDPNDPYTTEDLIDEGVDYNGSLIGNTFDEIDEDDENATDEIDEGTN